MEKITVQWKKAGTLNDPGYSLISYLNTVPAEKENKTMEKITVLLMIQVIHY